jgi:hypothetical protein
LPLSFLTTPLILLPSYQVHRLNFSVLILPYYQ